MPHPFAKSVLVTTMLVLAIPASTRAQLADSADDVCAPDADPCIIRESVEVDGGATVLDFGTRAVRLEGGGQLRFTHWVEQTTPWIVPTNIFCGDFRADTDGPAIVVDLKGGGFEGDRWVSISARRSCSSHALPCMQDSECELGTCGVRRCSADPWFTCTSDSSCQAGPCVSRPGSARLCAGALKNCNTNADCDLGACPEEVTCSNRVYGNVACSTNEDCDAGTCSLGTASITMNSRIAGRSEFPPNVQLYATDDVVVNARVDVSSRSADRDGGELDLYSNFGDIVVDDRVFARGGSRSRGGIVEAYATHGSITISAPVNANGGDFDGGEIACFAGNDITVLSGLSASSVVGGGYGGYIDLEAGRNLTIGSGSDSSRPMAIRANGHEGAGYAGDGGEFYLSGGSDLHVFPNVRFRGEGAKPDGMGGYWSAISLGRMAIDGKLSIRGGGDGGYAELEAAGEMGVGPEAYFDLRGSSGGWLSLEGSADIDLRGSVDARATRTEGGSISIQSAGLVDVSGRLRMDGDAGTMVVDACRIGISGTVENRGTDALNRLVAHESMSIAYAGELVAHAGSNVLAFRTSEKPPLLLGSVSPLPSLVVDPTLSGCPVCGNREIDEGEGCDDGNTVDGDGCSDACQVE